MTTDPFADVVTKTVTTTLDTLPFGNVVGDIVVDDDVDEGGVYLGPDEMQGASGPGLGERKDYTFYLYLLPLYQ